MTAPRINPERLWADITALAALTEAERPYTRRAFTPMFHRGRAYLAEQFAWAGLEVRTDTGGNLIGRRSGSGPKSRAIATGSHSDTVRAGGRFDGIAGVVAGLEVARALRDAGLSLNRPFEVIDFLAEEPSDFGISCIGSRAMTGKLDAPMLAATADGRTLAEALREAGGDPERLRERERGDIMAFLELHIEQGPVLEQRGVDIGIVTAIVAIRRLEVTFRGEAAHAGTSPMHMRRDAAYAGALALVAIRERAEALSKAGLGYFVATVGIVDVLPGGSNVVPARCRLVVDIRSSEEALIDEFCVALEADAKAAARSSDTDLLPIAVMSDGPAAVCDPALRDIIRHAADTTGHSAIDIASGAGHDAGFLAAICPTAMIFIPCRNGVSHAPMEYASPEQLAIGAEVLLASILAIDAL